jgi:hypothetical protein
MRNTLIIGLAIVGCTAFAGTARATTIDFNNNSVTETGGTLTFSDVLGSTATVTDAKVSLVGDITSATPPAPLSISGLCGSLGCVDLTTGGLTNFNLATRTYTYSSVGSSLTVTGNTAAGSGTLLSATFFGDIIIQINSGVTGGNLSGTLTGGGQLLPSLAAYFGVSPTINTGQDTEQFFRLNFGNGTNSAATISSSNIEVESQVPEPGTMLLFGSGLLGLGAGIRKRFGKRA